MISPLKVVSEDERRTLAEIGAGYTWKVCKYLQIKSKAAIGNHLHKEKDECFFLIRGKGDVTLGTLQVKVKAPVVIHVPRGTFHCFRLSPGSLLMCLSTEEHNPNDDHKA